MLSIEVLVTLAFLTKKRSGDTTTRTQRGTEIDSELTKACYALLRFILRMGTRDISPCSSQTLKSDNKDPATFER